VADTATAPRAAIDLSALEASLGGKRSQVLKLIPIFLDECATHMTAIRQAIDNGDAAKMRVAAHTLKGSLWHFGAERSAELAQRLEEMGKREEFDGANATFAELEPELQTLLASLRTYAEN
jgi:HPt (histidine-containing phosphotransfer) domain-containing protein